MKKILGKRKVFILTALLAASLVILVPSETQAWDPVQVCQRAGSRIEQHLSRYTEHKEDFVQRVDGAIDKLKDINQKLKDKGCDTSRLEADYQSLGTQLNSWVNDYNLFVNLLNEAKTLACAESEGAYRDKVRQTREQLQTVRQKGKAILDLYSGTIRPDIEVLKDSCLPNID